ncbi:hypothetical protein GJ496_007359 [Pomphorhynchus laevis]|nr:hypothetical protein GJ496_007359 [Pomphorhynchus laevis]
MNVPCLLRYIFLGPLFPLYFFNNELRLTTPSTKCSVRSLVIRIMWDPPIMATSYILYKIFGVRLLHDGYNGFVTYVNKRLLISSYPFPEDVERLYTNYKVRSVVNMCAEYSGPTKEYSRRLITHLHLPTIDGTVPRLEDVKKAVEFIENRLEEQDPDTTVLVHCKGGRGRAASVILCYLIKNEKISVKDAFDKIYAKRPVLESSILNYQLYSEFYQIA